MCCRVLWLLALFLPSVLPAAELPPNIIWIVADDLGYGETSCQHPATDVPTPQIDSIAANGVRCTNGYVTAPYCAASRAGVMTGCYQTRFGFEFNPIGPTNEEPGVGLPVSEKTIADRLRDEAGYTTMAVGKWHLGGAAPFTPLRRGFDEFFGFLHEGHYYRPSPYADMTTWLRRKTLPGGGKGRWTSGDGLLVYSTHIGRNEPDYDADNPILRNGQPIDETENLTDAFTREATDFIERCGTERPFFLYLAYNAVHSPLQAEAQYLENHTNIPDIQRRIFAALLSQLDDGVGKVLEEVKKQGLEQRTFIAFFSDNGGPTKELTSRNTPLRGEKGELFEGGIRVPFFVQYPGVIEAGKVYDPAIISLDLFATALSLAGLPDDPKLDGVSLLPYLVGEASGNPHDELFWRVGPRAALRQGDWKLVREPQQKSAGPWQLYDLAADPGEASDLAPARPDVLAELVKRWESTNAEMVDPLF
jgi:arylsulfatase A-like enzyme